MNYFRDRFQLRPIRVAATLTALALVLAACGGSTASADSLVEQHEESQQQEVFNFGKPADAAETDRVIEIDANDNLTFDASEITVSARSTITFRITNTRNIPHAFTLAHQTTQHK